MRPSPDLRVTEFTELGLAAPLRQAIAERPALADRAQVMLVGEARAYRDEGVTCEPSGQHLGFRVDAARFADPAGLLGWARHALGHAEDTLDPAFDFDPAWDGAGTGSSLRAVTQARLHRLWDVTVDGRLEAAGMSAGRSARARHRDRIAADLGGASVAAIDAILDRLWNDPRPTFPALRDWALRPASLIDDLAPEHPGLPRPDRCPLCRFPSDDVLVPDPAIGDQVLAEYPSWRPADGLCGRCVDRYRFARLLGGSE